MKKLAPLFALVLILLPLAGWTSASRDQPAFSRSRWIAERQARGARFSGGLLPADPAQVQASLDKRLDKRTPRPPHGLPAGVVRVSADILPPDGGAAEPETEAEPFLAADPMSGGHLLAGYQEERFASGGCRALTWAVSRNGGRTWQEGLIPNLTVASGGPYERASDPWVAFGPGGRAYYVSLAFNETNPQNGVFVSASADGGLTWGEPVAVHSGTQSMDDKEAIVVDTRSDSPYQGRVYVGWDSVSAAGQQELFSYSDDGGASFHPPVLLESQGANIGIVPVVGPGGVVYALWLNFPGGRGAALVVSKSTDGGATWSAPAVIADIQTAGVPGSRTSDGDPAVAIDARTGALYVAWQDDRFTPGVDQIILIRSTDGGESWSDPRLVSDGPGDAPNFTPALAVTPEGLVGVAYYSLRNDPTRSALVDEYLAVSRDAGQRFAKSLRMTGASWDLRFAAMSRGFFLGDYQGLATASRTFYPFWIATYLPSRIDPAARQPDAVTRTFRVPR
jgi:hypothetical protein